MKKILILAAILLLIAGCSLKNGRENTGTNQNVTAKNCTSTCDQELDCQQGEKCRQTPCPDDQTTTIKTCQAVKQNIFVSEPKDNQEIGLPLIVKGDARVFENTFIVRVSDNKGNKLAETTAMSESPDAGYFGSFNIQVNYNKPASETGIVEVFQYSAKDGTETDKVIIPVKFIAVEDMTVNVYFGSEKLNPEVMDCRLVYPIQRRIAKTEAVGKAAIEELLKGPTPEEINEKFYTSINSGVKLQSLIIKDKTAYADFDDRLEAAVGGSCRVAAIRSQITTTLKQFATVENVIISINGRTEDILQP
ncbi:hypothetical protein C4569_00455 [Candidatus Parcubacteria bacterium]|nr:MAG: hypothetical protein C4569_00455 [Candidatus Parcubacteria bacterium]